MDLVVSFYKNDADKIIAAFKGNDLNTVEKIHTTHTTESSQMQVLLPAIIHAGEQAKKDPGFALSVSEYVNLHSMGLGDAEKAMLRALRANNLPKAREAHLMGADLDVFAEKIKVWPHSTAFQPLYAYLEQYGAGNPLPPSAGTVAARKTPRLRVV